MLIGGRSSGAAEDVGAAIECGDTDLLRVGSLLPVGLPAPPSHRRSLNQRAAVHPLMTDGGVIIKELCGDITHSPLCGELATHLLFHCVNSTAQLLHDMQMVLRTRGLLCVSVCVDHGLLDCAFLFPSSEIYIAG